MRSEHRSWRKYNAVALCRLSQGERILDLREPCPDEHAVCGFGKQLKPDARSKAHITLRRARGFVVKGAEVAAACAATADKVRHLRSPS